MNAIDIVKKVERLSKKCGVTIFICKDRAQDETGRTAFYDKGEIHIFTEGKTDNWVAVHALHEFCHYLQEAKFVYDKGYLMLDKYYDTHSFSVELEVEQLTYRWLERLSADEDTLKECRQLVMENLRNYI